MKKIIALITAVLVSTTVSVAAFAAAAPADNQQVIETGITADTAADLSAQVSALKEDTISRTDLKAFKGKFINLFADLNKLRAECRDLWTSIKNVNTGIKTEWKSIKDSLKGKDKEEAKKILADIKTQVEPLRTQAKTVHSDIKTLRTQKTAEWTNYKAAVKAKDEAKAATALNNIISLKSQIVEKQKSLLSLKNDILNIFKAY